MAKYSYPAVFTPDSGGYSVTFPDWEGATCGDSPEDAVMMAEDFLNLACYDAECRHREFRKPTPIESIRAPEGGFVRLVEADTVAYDEVMKRVNNPISYELEKAGMALRRLADLLGAQYRTVEDWNAGCRTPPKWLQNLVIEKIRAAAGSTGDLREP